MLFEILILFSITVIFLPRERLIRNFNIFCGKEMKFYKCPLCCNLEFTNKQNLKEHLAKAVASITCPACYKPFKNIPFLIRHLDQCDVWGESQTDERNFNFTEYSEIDVNLDSFMTDNEEDDVEGYFCTVCDIKIPDVDKHIQQFHCGQEVILQDDDEEENEISNLPSVQNSNFDSEELKRKQEDSINSKTFKNKRFKKKTINEEEEEEEEENETFYCPKCDVIFQSLTEHTANYHETSNVLVQDVSIHELFPESRQTAGSFAYFCSCCQKTIVRKRTLMKHLKLNCYNDNSTKTTGRNVCRSRKNSNSINIKNSVVDGEKLEPGTIYEIEEVKPESYEFDDVNHSILTI